MKANNPIFKVAVANGFGVVKFQSWVPQWIRILIVRKFITVAFVKD